MRTDSKQEVLSFAKKRLWEVMISTSTPNRMSHIRKAILHYLLRDIMNNEFKLLGGGKLFR